MKMKQRVEVIKRNWHEKGQGDDVKTMRRKQPRWGDEGEPIKMKQGVEVMKRNWCREIDEDREMRRKQWILGDEERKCWC